MAFYSYLSTKIIIAFITKSYQDLFGVRSYINAFFYALIGYWRLPLRKIIVFALVANAPSVNSVKCNRFLFDKVATYNFL